MKKIKQLTPDQIARFPEWSEKWLKIGLSTERADWATAEAGVRGCYDTAKLKQPIIILRMGSPLAATLGGIYGVALSGSKKLHSQVESQVGSQVWSQVGSQVESQVGSQVWSQVGSQVESQVGNQVGSQVESQVGSQVGGQVWSQVESQVESQVGSQGGSQGERIVPQPRP